MKIVVDASALLAILLGEFDEEEYSSKVLAASTVWISPVNWWEVQVRMRNRYGTAGESKSAAWMSTMGIETEPVTLSQAKIALDAFARFRTSPAKLNMGDCFAYALAKEKDLPLLFKGSDFIHTDIAVA